MKIIATDNNYGKINGSYGDPCWYLLTHSCLHRDNKPLYIPDWDDDFRLFPSLAIRIDRLGKSIPERFAHRYWNVWSFGFAMRGMKTLRRLTEAGLPAEAACSFDTGAIISPQWHEAERNAMDTLRFSVSDGINELDVWKYVSLRLKADALIAFLSSRMTMKTGDIIFLGFPSEGIRLSRDMKIIVNKHIEPENDTISEPLCGFNIKAYPRESKGAIGHVNDPSTR